MASTTTSLRLFLLLCCWKWTLAQIQPSSSVDAEGITLTADDIQALGSSERSGFVACTANIEPLVECDPGQPEATYSGYHIELFREAAEKIGLTNYTIECMSFGDMLTDLLGGGEKCDMGAGAITLSTDRADRGILFTHPTYRGSLGVLTKAQVLQGSTWGFLKPLDWSVWLATGITSLVVPLVVFAVDALAFETGQRKLDVSRLRSTVWDSLYALMQTGSFSVHSQSARIIILGYAFMILIIINTYVANLAAFLTITNIDSTITSIGDLIGKNVGTGDVYRSRLRRNGIVAKTFASSMKEEAVREFQLGLNNYDAVVYDEPWITYVAATWGCDLRSLPEKFEPFDYAFAIPKGGNRSLEEQFSRALVVLQEEGTMARLQEKFVGVEVSGCPSEGEVSETVAVSFDQLEGLWILLGICFGLSLVVLTAKWIRIAWRMTKEGQEGKGILGRFSSLRDSASHPKQFVKAFRQASTKAAAASGDDVKQDLGSTLAELAKTLACMKEEQENLRLQMQGVASVVSALAESKLEEEKTIGLVVVDQDT